MTYIMAFHPDNIIRRNGKRDISLADFRAANPYVPIVDGQFFQLDENRLIIMNSRGEGNIADMSEYNGLIESIKNPHIPSEDKIYPMDKDPHTYLELDSIIGIAPSSDEGIPVGFTVTNGIQTWIYRDKTQSEILEDNKKKVIAEIIRLEMQITPRRIRESILDIDNGWLENQELLIANKRKEL